MKSKDLYNYITQELIEYMEETEAKSIVRLLLEEITGKKHSDLLLQDRIHLNNEQKSFLHEAVERLLLFEPVQYILGKAHFYGRDFHVTPDVLIPRRETEELVYYILADKPKADSHILDIGTGSGCIPITLKLERPNFTVEAIDVSPEALKVAKENAFNLGATVVFHQLDILSNLPLLGSYDVIVSNPPYVLNSEQAQMEDNVLEYEPHLALFVADNEPLLFYKVIIEKAKLALKKGGKIYFEINEQFGKEVADELLNANFKGVQVLKDMQGKDRVVSATR